MAVQLGGISLRMGVNAADFYTEIQKINSTLGGFQKKVRGMSRGLSKLAGAAGIGIGVGGAVAGLSQLVTEINAASVAAERLGFSTTKGFQALQFAAKGSGVEVGQLEESIQRLLRRTSEGIMGKGQAIPGFETINLDPFKAAQMSSEELFNTVLKGVNELDSVADKVRVAFNLMDTQGAKVLTERFARLNPILQELFKQVRPDVEGLEEGSFKITQAWLLVSEAAKGFGEELLVIIDGPLVAMLEWLAKMTNGLRQWMADVRAWGASVEKAVGKAFGSDLAKKAKVSAQVISKAFDNILPEWMKPAAKTLGKFGPGVGVSQLIPKPPPIKAEELRVPGLGKIKEETAELKELGTAFGPTIAALSQVETNLQKLATSNAIQTFRKKAVADANLFGAAMADVARKAPEHMKESLLAIAKGADQFTEIDKLSKMIAASGKNITKESTQEMSKDINATITRLKALTKVQAAVDIASKKPKVTKDPQMEFIARADNMIRGMRQATEGVGGTMLQKDMAMLEEFFDQWETKLGKVTPKLEKWRAELTAAAEAKDQAFTSEKLEEWNQSLDKTLNPLREQLGFYSEEDRLLDDLIAKVGDLSEAQIKAAQVEIKAHVVKNKHLEETAEHLAEVRDVGRTVGETLGGALSEVAHQGASLNDVMENLAASLFNLANQKLLLEPLGNLFSDMAGGFTQSGTGSSGGAQSGGGFGTAVGSFFGDMFSGWFAEGGMIPSGKFGIAGESGPELISGPARVTPLAHAGAGATNMTFNVTTPDVDSFRASRGLLEQEMSASATKQVRRRG